jgi:hypothetical protein
MEFGSRKFTKGEKELELLHGLWMMIIVIATIIKIILNIISHTSNVNISLLKHLVSSCFISKSAILSCAIGHKQPRDFA